MLFRTTVVAAFAALLANGVMATPIENRSVDAVLIATDPVSACNCPNNCSYGQGHSCKYKSGPSTSSKTVDGTCQSQNGQLTCIPST